MSLYSQYITERTNDQIIESDQGFITWRYLDGALVYIVDLFILPEFRNSKAATLLADQVVYEAKAKGCKAVIGSVVPSTKGSDTSIKVLQSYGMKLDSASDNLIIFKKEI